MTPPNFDFHIKNAKQEAKIGPFWGMEPVGKEG
jgi:hypothetical protein